VLGLGKSGDLSNSIVYKLLKDFSLPLLAIVWAIYTWLRQNRRKLSIRQVGDQYSDRIDSSLNCLTTYSVEVAITNDSPQRTIAIAYYDIELPWNEPNLEPLFDPRELDPPKDFYTIHNFGKTQVDRDKVLNHRRYQYGKLSPGEAYRGCFLAKGESPLPDDISNGSDRFIQATFVVQDTTGKKYKAPIYLHFYC
jgi:hypothetical protein